MATITGQLTYRQRIALIPGSTAIVRLYDTSKQDTAAPVITESTIELGAQQVPIPFTLVVDEAGLDQRGTYSLRASITGPGGDLQWTTDAHNRIDISTGEVDVGVVTLVQAGGAACDAADSEPQNRAAPSASVGAEGLEPPTTSL